VVHLDDGGQISASWQSVVNPGSHIGDVSQYGVSTAELLRAPSFEQIAPRLVELFRGRMLVTHNAQFVTGFLMREFELIGYAPGRGLEAVCTMHLARSYLPGAGRLLGDCCAAYDIDIDTDRGALGQALACASLLTAYIHSSASAVPWMNALDRAERCHWPVIAGDSLVEWVQRDPMVSSDPTCTPSFLAEMVLRLADYTGPDKHLDYLALLDLCLVDQRLSYRETRELAVAAEFCAISSADCNALHQQYFEELIRVAWSNGPLGVAHSADLMAVAHLLNIAPNAIAAALAHAPAAARPTVASIDSVLLERGDIVVLTGDMARARSDWSRELVARGLSIGTAVTLRTRLLVAANPEAATGKTGKARDYGIPIVSEFGLRALIGVR
jgi:DNA polymerase-3 subunit epsilon